MSFLRIAQAQINTTVGDLGGNVARITRAIDAAKKIGADIVTLPELSISGYPPEDLLLKPHFILDCRAALDRLIDKTKDITAVVGFPDAADGAVKNAAALIADRQLVGIYHKVELPNYGVFDEKRYFERGSTPLVCSMRGFTLLITVCEDIWIEGSIVERFALDNDVDITLNISASPFHAGKFVEVRQEIASRFARRTNTYVCYTNLIGGQDELVFDGGSLVMSPDGTCLSLAERFREDLLPFDFSEEITSKTPPRREKGQRKTRGKTKKEPLILATRNGEKRGKTPARNPHPLKKIEEIYHALVLGTADYVRKNGFEKVVIGLSGGIDSSVTAAVAVAALRAENVQGVTMPSVYTSSETRSDAAVLAENLKIPFLTVPIQPIYQSYLAALAEPLGTDYLGVTAENIQARIRGNILMALSNRFGWLVLTTGNKSETAVGYCTLYGDMAGGFAVIKDVPKTLVYELAEFINEIHGFDVIPESVIRRPPSAELRPDQKDEDSLPPYAQLDAILHAYVEEDKDPEAIISQGFNEDMVWDVLNMVDKNEYKRRQAPPGIKITPKAFGKDRRLPITNRYLKNKLPTDPPPQKTE
jgi:NAD+ synthase (glutamine-hydrolysing)